MVISLAPNSRQEKVNVDDYFKRRTCRRKCMIPLMHFYCLTIEVATVYAQSREKNYCTEKNYIKAEATLTKNVGMNAIKKLL